MMAKTITPPNTATDQFIVCAVTVIVGGQNEKKMPIIEYKMAMMLTGRPMRPSLNGPQCISEAGVVKRLWSSAHAEIRNVE